MDVVMANKTRQFFLRALFVAVCILPTMVVLAWALVGETPRDRVVQLKYWRTILERKLGVAVEIESVERFDSTIVLSGVRLSDKETNLPLASAEQVTIYPGEKLTQIVASHSQFFTKQLDLIHRAVVSLQRTRLEKPVVLDAARCTLTGQDARTLTDIRAQIQQTNERAHWDVAFRVAGSAMPSKCQFTLLRDRSADRPLVSWKLNTGTTRLPLSVAWSVCPVLRFLGESCEFRGSLVSKGDSSDGKQIQLSGTLSNIELDEIFRSFYHRLTGKGVLFLSFAEIRNSVLVSASGRLQSNGGTISSRLMESARDAFHLTFDPKFSEKLSYRYGKLAFAFRIQGGKLAVRGYGRQHAGATSPAVVEWAGGPLTMLGGGSKGLIPALAVSQLMVPGSAHKISATRDVYRFLKYLPVPAIQRPPGWDKRKPQTSIRVAK